MRWAAPAVNTGPAVSDYDLRWREDGAGDDAWTERDDTVASTVRSATVPGLALASAWQGAGARENERGAGEWSASGTASAGANHPPRLPPVLLVPVLENQTRLPAVALRRTRTPATR